MPVSTNARHSVSPELVEGLPLLFGPCAPSQGQGQPFERLRACGTCRIQRTRTTPFVLSLSKDCPRSAGHALHCKAEGQPSGRLRASGVVREGAENCPSRLFEPGEAAAFCAENAPERPKAARSARGTRRPLVRQWAALLRAPCPEDQMSSSASGPAIRPSETCSVRLRIAASSRSQTSLFSRR